MRINSIIQIIQFPCQKKFPIHLLDFLWK
jgi:hypothetical protein